MYTFDNAFQLSFLFRDGRLAIESGDDGMPYVRPVLSKGRDVQNKENVQFAVTLDYDKLQVKLKINILHLNENKPIVIKSQIYILYLQAMMQKYNIKEAMIKYDRNLYQNEEQN